MKVNPADIERAVERGLIPAGAVPTKPQKRKPPVLIDPSFRIPGTWTVAVETVSEINGRDWRGRSARTQAARKAVSRIFGAFLANLAPFAGHYHRGGKLRVVFTRIGGTRLDRSNLPTALKAVEDAVCFMLGADDGDPRWEPDWQQEPGPGPVGVRVELMRLDRSE